MNTKGIEPELLEIQARGVSRKEQPAALEALYVLFRNLELSNANESGGDVADSVFEEEIPGKAFRYAVEWGWVLVKPFVLRRRPTIVLDDPWMMSDLDIGSFSSWHSYNAIRSAPEPPPDPMTHFGGIETTERVKKGFLKRLEACILAAKARELRRRRARSEPGAASELDIKPRNTEAPRNKGGRPKSGNIDGQQLKECRSVLGQKQEQFIRNSGISLKTYGKAEAGTASAETIRCLNRLMKKKNPGWSGTLEISQKPNKNTKKK